MQACCLDGDGYDSRPSAQTALSDKDDGIHRRWTPLAAIERSPASSEVMKDDSSVYIAAIIQDEA